MCGYSLTVIDRCAGREELMSTGFGGTHQELEKYLSAPECRFESFLGPPLRSERHGWVAGCSPREGRRRWPYMSGFTMEDSWAVDAVVVKELREDKLDDYITNKQSVGSFLYEALSKSRTKKGSELMLRRAFTVRSPEYVMELQSYLDSFQRVTAFYNQIHRQALSTSKVHEDQLATRLRAMGFELSCTIQQEALVCFKVEGICNSLFFDTGREYGLQWKEKMATPFLTKRLSAVRV